MLQTGVAPEQSPFCAHPVQVFVVTAHFCEPHGVLSTHLTHLPPVREQLPGAAPEQFSIWVLLHSDVAPEQSVFVVHVELLDGVAQVCVVVLQMAGVVQSKLLEQRGQLHSTWTNRLFCGFPLHCCPNCRSGRGPCAV